MYGVRYTVSHNRLRATFYLALAAPLSAQCRSGPAGPQALWAPGPMAGPWTTPKLCGSYGPAGPLTPFHGRASGVPDRHWSRIPPNLGLRRFRLGRNLNTSIGDGTQLNISVKVNISVISNLLGH